jgi:protein SCO1/2
MFVKIVILLLLLIVAASLLVQRTGIAGAQGKRPNPGVRTLFMRMAVILFAIAAAVAAVHFLSGCAPQSKSFHAQDISGANYAQLGRLDGFVDHRGSRLASADFRGKAVVLFFGYTHCPDICPTTLTTMKDALRLLGQDGERVQVLFVTVDPERDTQTVLADYVPWFDERFIGLRAEPDATRSAAQSFKVFYAKANTGMGTNAYGIDHTAETYAYDALGRLRLKIPHGATSQQIAEDLAKLLAGQ